MERIIRVFPRRTRATPTDDLVRINTYPGIFDEADKVFISVTFTWDLPLAERLAQSWKYVAPLSIGGPATGEPSGNFTPGLFLKPGYTITSRGCPNDCWFCEVPKREGNIRELPIQPGYNILDDNLLACSEPHIRSVFNMLLQQPQQSQFTGGIEARRLLPWHAQELLKLHPKQIFFAYDTPDDLVPLIYASNLMLSAGFKQSNHTLRCFILCGYPNDTITLAKQRMKQTLSLGFTPMAMLWKDNTGNYNPTWRQFQRLWTRPAIIHGTYLANTIPINENNTIC